MPPDSLDNFFAQLINTAAEVAQTLAVGEKPKIKFTGARNISGEEITQLMQSNQVFKADFGGESEGKLIMVIPETLALALSGSLMGADKPVSFGSAEKSAVFELLNNIAGRWALYWGEAVEDKFAITSPEIPDPPVEGPASDETWVEVSAGVVIGEDESSLRCFFPVQFVDATVKKLGLPLKAPEEIMDEETTKNEESESVEEEKTPDEQVDTTEETEIPDESQTPIEAEPPAEPPVKPPVEPPVEQSAHIQQAQFSQLTDNKQEPADEDSDNRSINLIMDVPLLVSVELGRKELSIKDILELSPGSLIELNQLAGEPVDLLINGKLFARGEVVVIDENFGIRVTAIISPQERVEKMRQ
ncbi:flagellar motor switch protein FliN [bacterium]|nr:flagellar motor switch protein FliN [bacterium]